MKRWHAGYPEDHDVSILLRELVMKEAQLRIRGEWH
jgi:hypothetical protein